MTDRTAELRRQFCGPLAVEVVAQVLGVPTDTEQLRAWYDEFAAALANFQRDPDIRERGRQATESFRAAVLPLLKRFEREPDHSLLSVLVHTKTGRLSESEILSNSMLILFGGIETTESMLLNT